MHHPTSLSLRTSHQGIIIRHGLAEADEEQILSRMCNGTSAPLENEMVTFLGAYSDANPGILTDMRVYDDYMLPGPAKVVLVSADTDAKSTSSSGTSATNTTSAADTTATASGVSGFAHPDAARANGSKGTGADLALSALPHALWSPSTHHQQPTFNFSNPSTCWSSLKVFLDPDAHVDVPGVDA
ncbi:hypothetical protein BT96DRAFT_1021824 [Gymnopus androsaceus JB14]|uniref:Uncharacterized protein n=1 Tax=Gymnopus androsaceus JB14 TaxID=1447944 RepID=A0A6A4HD37_9AGAR|nr:hypothetical protein BT96DRAFT_1021824 [Gymnopus androsaceus JB14]